MGLEMEIRVADEFQIKNVITINDFDYLQGGATKVAIDTANLLTEYGINSVFFSAVHKDDGSLLPSVKNISCNTYEALKHPNIVKGMIQGVKNIQCANKLQRLLVKYDPNNTIVHVHGWTKSCSSAIFPIIKKMGFTTVLTIHEYFSICATGELFNYRTGKPCNLKCGTLKCKLSNCDSRNYAFKIYRNIREGKYYADMDMKYIYPIYISLFEKNVMDNHMPKYKKTNGEYSIIPNIVELPQETDKQHQYDFVYVGRVSKDKGIDLVVKMTQLLPEKKFLIIGEKGIYKFPENTTVTGWITETQVEKYISLARILLFPSMWPETFGLNAIKYLAAGKTCLISSNTAAASYEEFSNCVIFRQGDINDLLKKASIILDKPNYFMAEVNKDLIYTKEKYISHTLNAYKQALKIRMHQD